MARPVVRALVLLAWLALALQWARSGNPEPWTWKKIAGRWNYSEFQHNLLLTGVLAGGTAVVLARRRREAALRVGLVAGAVAGTFALLELPAALGWLDWSRLIGLPPEVRFTRLKPWENPSNVPDPDLVFRRRPGAAFSGRIAGDLVYLFGIATDRRYPVDVRYDANGFRNARTPGHADVVVVGDSFVEAGLTPLEETLPVRLEARLGVQVANLGQSAYGPRQERIVLERYGLPLAPRQVVWMFFEGNDLLDDARFEGFLRERRRPPGSSWADRSLLRGLMPRLALLTGGLPAQDAARARARRGDCGGHAFYFAYPSRPLPEDEEAALPGVWEEILAARRSARQAGAELLLAFIPIKHRVYGDLCHFAPHSDPAEWRPNDLPARMAELACRERVPFVDLTPSLRDAAARGETVFFPDDGHWSGAGQAVAADAIADALARGAPPCPAATGAAPLRPADAPRTAAARP